MVENIAAKLDDMLLHSAPPVDMGGPRPVPGHLFGEGGMVVYGPEPKATPEPGYHEPFVLHDQTLNGFADRSLAPTKGAVVKMAKELIDHRAKLTPVAPEPIKRGHCVFPKCGCRGNCGALTDSPVPDGVFRPAPKPDDGRLYEAARAVYAAAHWYTPTLASNEQLKLWTELRDALGLKPGAPNKPSIVVTNTPRWPEPLHTPRFPFPRD